MYVPPKMRAGTFTDMIEVVINAISEIKSKDNDPVVMIGGDMNWKSLSPLLVDAFLDLALSPTGPTRGNVCLDLVATNREEAMVSAKIFPPLETPDGRKSDRNVIYGINVMKLVKNVRLAGELTKLERGQMRGKPSSLTCSVSRTGLC